MAGMRIQKFDISYQEQVIQLILGIQQQEFNIPITIHQQPDLKEIPSFYQRDKGNFWLALDEDRVVGTIALIDIGGMRGALRKMFVHPAYRGKEKGTAQKLLQALLDWSHKQQLHEIYLG